MMDWGDGMWSGNWTMLLVAIAFLAVVIVGIVFVVRALSVSGAGGDRTAGDRHGPAHEIPEDLVRRRYAAGEIDRGEYEQKLRDLSG